MGERKEVERRGRKKERRWEKREREKEGGRVGNKASSVL